MLNQPFIAELKHEAASTKRILERVPEDKFNWKPHEKSMTLGRLASHVAELPGFLNPILIMDEFDFAKGHYKPSAVKTQRTNDRFLCSIQFCNLCSYFSFEFCSKFGVICKKLFYCIAALSQLRCIITKPASAFLYNIHFNTHINNLTGL